MNKNFNNIPQDAADLLRSKGIDPNTTKGDAQKILSSLNKQDAEKINNLLNNKEELNKLLNSDAAKQIMQKFFGGGAK